MLARTWKKLGFLYTVGGNIKRVQPLKDTSLVIQNLSIGGARGTGLVGKALAPQV